jgi:hypothetical protein
MEDENTKDTKSFSKVDEDALVSLFAILLAIGFILAVG